MKRRWTAALAVLTAMSLMAGCASPAALEETPAAPTDAPAATAQIQQNTPPEAAGMTPGVYTVTAMGHNGDFTVDVTLDEDSITAIEFGTNYESPKQGTVAMEQVREEILAGQTLSVDSVTGATFSGNAVIAAVKEAIVQAGGDVEMFSAAPEKEKEAYQDAQTQVLVVGAGGAGLAAAMRAKDLGMDVILIDQLGYLGGSSVRAGYLMGADTDLQKAAGIEYTRQDYIDSLMQDADDEDPLFQEASVAPTVDTVTETINWLSGEHGVPFSVSSYAHAEEGFGGGGALMTAVLREEMENAQMDIRLETRAENLLVEDGRVTGAAVTAPDGSSYQIHADAVILATGGYNGNPEMIAKYKPEFANAVTDASFGADGSGMLMAEAVGAPLIAMDRANYRFGVSWRVGGRSMVWAMGCGAVAVNKEGQRFANEDHNKGEAEVTAITRQTDGVCYLIMDQACMDAICALPSQAFHEAMCEKADTLEELAQKLGIDGESLGETMQKYGEYVKNGEDPDFGRKNSLTSSFETGPYYGVKAYPEVHTDFGGVKVDVDTRVLDEEGTPITGLYAAGEVAASHVGGDGFSICVSKGYRAAETVQADLN